MIIEGDEYQPSVECAEFTPLYDFCLVRRLPDPDEERGLAIPESARDKYLGHRTGVVEKCGAGDVQWKHKGQPGMDFLDKDALIYFRHPMGVQPGDKVLYVRSPANEVRLNGVEYQLCHEESQILAVLG